MEDPKNWRRRKRTQGAFPTDPPMDPPLILLRSSRRAFGEDLGTGKYGSLYNSPRRGYSNVVHWVCFHRRFRGGGRWVLVGVVLIRFGLREGWT